MNNMFKRLSMGVAMVALVCSYSVAYASPATPTMVDAEGCQVCNGDCAKFGLQNGQKHCHVFAPEAMSIYIKTASDSSTNHEKTYAKNVLAAMEYIAFDQTKSRLMIAPISKQIEGSYGIVRQNCAFGAKDIVIKRGAPSGFKKIFGAPYDRGAAGIFQVTIGNRDHMGIATADDRLLIVEPKDEIGCSGQFLKGRLYIYCKTEISAKETLFSNDYCRALLKKH